MTDPRVELLARSLEAAHKWEPQTMSALFWSNQARLQIAEFEAAGLIVLAEDNATLDRIARALCNGTDAFLPMHSAAKVLSALRSSPPADFPAAGGAPGDGAE